MNPRRQGVLPALAVLVIAASVVCVGAGPQSPVQRTIYVTVTDGRGHVAGLTAADLIVREGGREREIVRLEPSGERLRTAIALDELLAPDMAIRQAVLHLFRRLRESGDVALYVMGRVNQRAVDYTTELGPFISAINALPISPRYPGNLVESVYQTLLHQRPLEGRRAVVVVAPEMSQFSAMRAEAVFDQLRETGAVLHAATFEGWRTLAGTLQEVPPTRLEGGDITELVERDRVLGDGPKRSGGLRVPASRADGFVGVFDRIVDDLAHQYRVSYVLPAGTRSDGRVSLAAKRRGVTVRGPSRLTDVP